MRRVRRTRRPLVALIALLVALAVGYGVRAVSSVDQATPTPSSTAPSAGPSTEVALSSLPVQVAATVHLVQSGGPFPYPRNDGAVFRNNEGRLPHEDTGYYREYTVPTPGSPDRGARRLITGRGGEYWYTADHYETFERVDIRR